MVPLSFALTTAVGEREDENRVGGTDGYVFFSHDVLSDLYLAPLYTTEKRENKIEYTSQEEEKETEIVRLTTR